jgi:parvulin-like peptidyl-prolyl isomerase
MKDGVEYVLRFGKTYRGPEDDENSTGDSRYIYAFARVNPSLLDPPALESMQKEFQSKVEKAQERVKALNENLSNWYYVISNEVYEKIRLERKDFVRVKEEDGKARPEEVKASHILISYKGADRADADITRSKEEAKAEAERIRKLIVDEGKDFAEMASEHSNGPSKTKGGDLGKFKFEGMAPSFSAAAFVLEVGTVSDVVETGFGFHVIKRTE